MVVYQGGRDEIPQALLRFQLAVGGRGNITGPYRNRLFHWSTKRHAAFDEEMIILWPWLSGSKRAQLQRATETAGRVMPPECGVDTADAQLHRANELAWVAGFFDGEGYIGTGGSRGKRTIEMSIAQAGAAGLPATLTRVAFVLAAGRLRGPRMLANPWSKLPQYVWCARSFEDVQLSVALLWAWLGPVKRAQARQALLRYRALGRAA